MNQLSNQALAPNADQLSAIAKSLYTEGPLLLRKLQHWRPYICPFERLVVHVPDGARVMDIGCGAGLLLSLTAGLGVRFEGVGFDVSHQAIRLAQRMSQGSAAKSLKAKLSFQRLDAGSVWPDGLFDVVFLVDVLHHVSPQHQESVVRQAISKVRPEGIFVYKDMCRKPLWRAIANRLHDLVLARDWIHYVPIETVEAWATEAGMRVSARDEFQRFWYGHEMLIMQQARTPEVPIGG